MLSTTTLRLRGVTVRLRICLRASLVMVTFLSSLRVTAGAIDRQNVTDIKPLLLTALNRGEAHGVLVGEAAQWVERYFKSTAPIEIDVKTVKPLSRPGCVRLAITTTQDGVWDFNREKHASTPERKAFTWTVNYCRDGNLLNEEPS